MLLTDTSSNPYNAEYTNYQNIFLKPRINEEERGEKAKQTVPLNLTQPHTCFPAMSQSQRVVNMRPSTTSVCHTNYFFSVYPSSSEWPFFLAEWPFFQQSGPCLSRVALVPAETCYLATPALGSRLSTWPEMNCRDC